LLSLTVALKAGNRYATNAIATASATTKDQPPGRAVRVHAKVLL